MAQRNSQRQSTQSFETVTPLASRNIEDEDLHLSLECFDNDEDIMSDDEDYSFSDENYESDVTLEEAEDGGLDFRTEQRSNRQAQATGKAGSNGDTKMCTAIAPAGGAADLYDVDSEEENELLRGIKDEIKDMVRAEMQSELAVYQDKVKAVEEGRLPSAQRDQEEIKKHPDLENMDPELREAYIKMYKLDRILAKRVKKEKEVKRERILLERRIRDEINSIQAVGRVQRDIKANTDKYLSLALPASHNEGVVVDERPITPVFQTQVNEQDLQGRSAGASASKTRLSNASESRQSSASSSHTHRTGSSEGREGSGKHGRRKKRKKDFIKRNKELAANAADAVVMTDDEKKRLKELLTDIDALPDIEEEGSEVSDNPFQLTLHAGEGFLPSDNDMRTLSSIDQRLQGLMPEEEFRSIASSSLSSVSQNRLFTNVGARTNIDWDHYGEVALRETKEEREAQAKLKTIEERLSEFHNVSDEPKSTTPHLTEAELDQLLDQCVRSMSRSSLPPDTPQSVSSEMSLESQRAQLMLNPPRLTDEQLQKLLSEAHFPLSSRLLALQDDDSKSAQSGDEGEAIRAETWKAIAEVTLSDDEGDTNRTPSTTTVVPSSTSVSQKNSRPTPTPPKPSFSETNIHPTKARQAFLRRSGSQLSDSEGRESRVSLPEICSSPFLINTLQGQGNGNGNNSGSSFDATLGHCSQNNDPRSYQNSYQNRSRVSSSLENMVYNDLSASSVRSSTSSISGGWRMSGTPLQVEDFGEGDQIPTPHPPHALGRQNSSGNGKSRSGSLKEKSK